MNGLKVYLKSRIHRIYLYIQIAVGILLLINAIHFLESEHKLVLEVLLSGFGGIIVLLCLALPANYRRRWRHLPGFLILASGSILFWNASTALEVMYTPWYTIFFYIGACLMVIGLLSPILNPKYFIYLSKRGIRVRSTPLPQQRLIWADITRVEMGDRHLEIETRKGRQFKLTPLGSQSQHLRAHIDEASRSGMLENVKKIQAQQPVAERENLPA